MIARTSGAVLSFALVVGLALPACAADSPRVTDLAPQKAIGSIFFRNVNELRAAGDKLFHEVGWPFPPSQLLSFVGQELKVNGLVDGSRPCGVAWFEFEDGGKPKPAGFQLPPAAAVFAIRDLDALAQRLGTTADELKSGETVHEEGRVGYDNRYYRFADDYLWIVTDERLFVEVSNRMPLTFAIAKSRRERMQNCDILVAFRPTAEVADREQMLKSGRKWLDEHPELGVEEQDAVRELFAVFEAMSNVVLGVRVRQDGIEADADIYFDFRKRKAVQAVLQRFNPTGAASSLNELPDGTVLFSHALKADGKATLPALNALLPELTLIGGWRRDSGREFLTDAQQLKLLGLFGEVWRRIDGYRMAAYASSDPLQHGLLSLVAVLDTDDPAQVIAEVRELTEFLDGARLFVAADPAERVQPEKDASEKPDEKTPQLSSEGEARVRNLVEQLGNDDFAVRQSATIRLMLIGEPTRPFIESLAAKDNDDAAVGKSVTVRHARRVLALLDTARSRASRSKATLRLFNSSDLRFGYSTEVDSDSDQTIHLIKVEHAADTEQQQKFQQQMRKLLGPEWNYLRLIPFKSRLLVVVGSDPNLQRQAVASVERHGQALQTATTASMYGPPLNAARGAEFHIDLAMIRELFSRRFKASGIPAADPPAESPLPASDAAEKPADKPAVDFSSLSFTIQDDYLSIEWRLPVTEIKTLNASN